MNTSANLSRHATVRSQQRGIPPLVIDWLIAYGQSEFVNGACYRFFDRPSRKRLARDVGERIVQMLSPVLDCYLVEGRDGRVVTVAHRYERVRRA